MAVKAPAGRGEPTRDAAPERLHLFIDGAFTPAAGGETFETRDPATGRLLAVVDKAGPGDVDRAVRSARRAFADPSWRDLHPAERGRILGRLAGLVRAHAEKLARWETLDTGKPLGQARTDVEVCARYFEYYAGVADKILGETIPVQPGFLDYTLREPYGVSAQVVPWNYPLQIAGRGCGAALAAGNAVVVKPARNTPTTALMLAQLGVEAGLPPGILNVVPGAGSEAGTALVAHPGVNHVTFTGSIEAGRDVMRRAAENVVPVTMELGGKSPNIVFADADLDAAVPFLVNAIIQNAGQTCSAASRLVVEERVHDAVVDRLAARMRSLRLGHGLDDPDMGPLVSAVQRDLVAGYMEAARAEGGAIVAGGKAPDAPGLRQGCFFEPTIVAGVAPTSRVAQEEIFGPVLTVLPFRTPEEALDIANGTEYGLVAGVFTRDVSKAHWMARHLRSGQVFINCYGAGGGVEMPFGGYGKSGFGREKGLEALRSYTQLKNVAVKFQ